jgi:hypothetical protein
MVRLGRRIGKNGSRHWVGAGMRDEIKIIINTIYIYIYRLTADNLTERATGIYKNVSNIQNLIFKRTLIKFKRILSGA